MDNESIGLIFLVKTGWWISKKDISVFGWLIILKITFYQINNRT